MAKKNKKSHRFNQIIRVLIRYRRGKFTPLKLRLILEDLGPTYVKIGQLMSIRTDILPHEYCKALETLRENVKPTDFPIMLPQIEEAIGKPIEEAFIEFDPVPIGTASIAQVYRAKLLTGEDVVVKVQKPGIYEMMELDIALLKRAVVFLKLIPKVSDVVDLNMIIDEIWEMTKKELDFTIEAQNAEVLRENNKAIKCIGIPIIYHQYTTSKILTMEYIDGLRIDQYDELEKEGYDLSDICLKLVENYVKQIVVDGFFHADPHQGNIRIRDGKIYWLDFGMVGTLSERDRDLYKSVIEGISKQDVNQVKTCVLIIGKCRGDVDQTKLYVDIEMMMQKYLTLHLGELNLGMLVDEFLSLANNNNIQMPSGMSIFCRGVMTIEGVIMKLDPKISIAEIFAKHVASIKFDDFDLKKTVFDFIKTLSTSFTKSSQIPSLLKDVLDLSLRGQAKVVVVNKVSKEVMSDVNYIAINVCLALFIIATLWGSITVLVSEHEFYRILNIPILSYLLFGIAIFISFIFIIRVFKKRK